MKKLVLSLLVLAAAGHAQASAIVCEKGAVKIEKTGDRGENTLVDITITDKAFIKEVKSKIAGGKVHFFCTGECKEHEGYVERAANPLVKNTVIETDAEGNESLKIKSLIADTDYYGKPVYMSLSQDESSAKQHDGGLDVSIHTPSEMGSSHSYLSYELQQWFFHDCSIQF